jgi:hypothetical protein
MYSDDLLWLYCTPNGRLTVCGDCTVQWILHWRCSLTLLYSELYIYGLLWLYCTANCTVTVCSDCSVQRMVQCLCSVTVLYGEWYSDGVLWLFFTESGKVPLCFDCTLDRMLEFRCVLTSLQRVVQWRFTVTLGLQGVRERAELSFTQLFILPFTPWI